MHLRSLNTLEEVASSRPAIRNAIKSLFFQTDGTNFWLEHHANRDRRRFDIWHALRQRAHETEGPRYISLLANHNTKDDAGRNAVVYAALLNCHSTNERANHDYPRPDADEPSDDAWQSAPRDDEARKDPQLISAFEHYKKLTKDEIRMSSESLVQAKLMGLFRSCPNLTKLSFNVKDILRRNNAFESPEWLRGLFVPHGATFQQPAAFMQTMSAAYDASVKLLDLSVGYGPELLDSFGDDERLHLALKDLTRLHWRVESADPWGNGNTGDFRDFSTSLCRGYLRQITSSCQKMQCLYLDMMHHPLDTHRAWLKAIISSDLVFQHLRHLRITNFQASPDQLSSLLLRHAKTLESLHLP
ncbi:hypothetical protein DOTSEDRAFT_72107 [Dothistroma septosporum NZE10]|uniref:Uncharacterized protein n=1 Tax=Dothistroma septosporum (strain NZE10 / CBS 128990) TaxID=675120 RepID=N1PNM9_DOTSN|nr:hypothetical protein DOTSEDRAFT_72107 [Dothistroma septosporum NZE10]